MSLYLDTVSISTYLPQACDIYKASTLDAEGLLGALGESLADVSARPTHTECTAHTVDLRSVHCGLRALCVCVAQVVTRLTIYGR